MKRKDTFNIAFTGILIAFMAILSVLGRIFPALASFTFVHIPLIVGVLLIKNWKYALGLGAAFGVISFINALFPPTPIDALFVNPLVSILPRILVGLVAFGAFKLVQNVRNKGVVAAVVAVAATLANTVFVLTALFLFYSGVLAEAGITVGVLVVAVLSLNVPVELVSSIVISVLVYLRMSDYLGNQEEVEIE